ncbi:hypothetical protein MMC25_005965 [Agyrium rufum]|nr:hypothetical protein [Agyrium rufum]
MNKHIHKELDRRFSSMQEAGGSAKRHVSVAESAIQYHLQELTSHVGDSTPQFRTEITGLIKSFLFAGYETTSTSICYVFYLLSKHEDVLKKVRDEHNSVLGTDPSVAASLISNNPALLNQLPLTLAVVKETLRLFPTVSSTRAGEVGFSVIGDDGKSYPTDNCLVWSIPQAIHRDPQYWPSPDNFIPERWLAEPGDPLYPVKSAWRPFEHGPRNCIAQELAITEMKVVMVMTARELEIKVVYEEWDALHPSRGPKSVAGERAYQVISGGPSDGLPCRAFAME